MTRHTTSGDSVDGSRLAAFDFDGTLRRGDSLLPFLSLIAGRRQALTAIATSAARLAFRSRGSGRDGIKDLTFAKLLSGRDAKTFTDIAEEFGAGLVNELRLDVVDRLRSHQDSGHAVVIVSASLTAYLRPVADHLGCDLIATNLVVDSDGRLDGRIEGLNCRGGEKVARLKSAFAERPSEVWAYGDSAGDNEMLEWADHGVRVGRALISAPW